MLSSSTNDSFKITLRTTTAEGVVVTPVVVGTSVVVGTLVVVVVVPSVVVVVVPSVVESSGVKNE